MDASLTCVEPVVVVARDVTTALEEPHEDMQADGKGSGGSYSADAAVAAGCAVAVHDDNVTCGNNESGARGLSWMGSGFGVQGFKSTVRRYWVEMQRRVSRAISRANKARAQQNLK